MPEDDDIKGDWAIGPFIGVARVGNSPDDFYIEPERAGVLPIEPASDGTARRHGDGHGHYVRVEAFKDGDGRIKRQAARFRVFRRVDGRWRPLCAADQATLTWSVHLANKKACWHDFKPLRGDLMFDDNGYGHSTSHTAVKWRNAGVTGEAGRRRLIIDFGRREVSRPGDRQRFEAGAGERDQHPAKLKHGEAITSLGEIRMNERQELLVLGGMGRAGGSRSITSFAGADGWCDDVSDGPVTCTVRIGEEVVADLKAWVIVGAPRFAPEIVNIVTLADVMEDVAIRNLGYRSGAYDPGRQDFDPGYRVDFDRDIRPILERPGAYRWVANVPVLQSISPPGFDVRNPFPSKDVVAARKAYVGLFRDANPDGRVDPSHNQLGNTRRPDPAPGFPAMPLNAGNNPVSNDAGVIDKFMSLTRTQLFMLQQWAEGKFVDSGYDRELLPEHYETPVSVTRGSLGNCVGAPLCPGIEVTWTVCNKHIYAGPFQILHRSPDKYAGGLDPARDETDFGASGDPGCEPGDLTKRMAVPWQADFFACAVQPIDFEDESINESDDIPAPPTYFAYWWPPQSPWQVISGELDVRRQALSGVSAGMPVLFMRGINTFSQTLNGWSYMGFVLNQTSGVHRELFPNFVERERNHDRFLPLATALGSSADVLGGENANFNYAWLLREPRVPAPTPAAAIPSSRRRGHRADE